MSYYKLLDTDQECIICMEPIEDRYTTKCQHDFCKTCIKRWVKENDSCPLCRVEDILIRCKECKKDTEVNNHEICDECQINLTEAKFDADILRKMQKEAKKEWKKLPLWKRTKIKTKLKCKKIFRKIIKPTFKAPFYLIKFLLGGCDFGRRNVSYKMGLAVLYIYLGFQFPFLSIPYLILVLYGVSQGIFGFIRMNNDENEDDLNVDRFDQILRGDNV